jgi:hypothetical protein
MRKKTIIFFSLVLPLGFACMVSCTKKQAADTPFTRIQGKWKKVQYATDDNNNGKIEAAEIHNVPSTMDNEITFTNEETGTETTFSNGVQSTPLTFNWKIVGADSVWIAYKANDTLTYFIAQVSSHNLQLTTNTKFGLASYYYGK